jgi:putative alpha-1,2-mannosidase
MLLSAPLFERATIRRANGRTIVIEAAGAGPGAFHIAELKIDGRPSTRSWIGESLVNGGGRLSFTLSTSATGTWGAGADDVPPSFPPPSVR